MPQFVWARSGDVKVGVTILRPVQNQIAHVNGFCVLNWPQLNRLPVEIQKFFRFVGYADRGRKGYFGNVSVEFPHNSFHKAYAVRSTLFNGAAGQVSGSVP